jgi:hypothetical protein
MANQTGGIQAGVVISFVSLAFAISVQGGMAIWWAGAQNTRVTALEDRVADLQAVSPDVHRQIVDADRRIAVIDVWISGIVARLEALTEDLEDLAAR